MAGQRPPRGRAGCAWSIGAWQYRIGTGWDESRESRKRRAVMEDQEVIDRINQLANEEHELFGKESRGEASESDKQRLQRLEVSLDQCWDLLHQRRARRAAGFDPNEASVRDETTVEGYVD